MAQAGVPSVRSLDPSTNYQAVDAENIRQISPKDILLFAKQILLYLFFLVLFVFALSYATAWVSPWLPVGLWGSRRKFDCARTVFRRFAGQ